MGGARAELSHYDRAAQLRHRARASTRTAARAYCLARAARAPSSAWPHRHFTHASHAKAKPITPRRAGGSVQPSAALRQGKPRPPALTIPEATAARHHATARRAALRFVSRRHAASRDERRCRLPRVSTARARAMRIARRHRHSATAAACEAHHSCTALRTDKLAAVFAHRRHARRISHVSAPSCAPAAMWRRRPTTAALRDQLSRADRARTPAEPCKPPARGTSECVPPVAIAGGGWVGGEGR